MGEINEINKELSRLEKTLQEALKQIGHSKYKIPEVLVLIRESLVRLVIIKEGITTFSSYMVKAKQALETELIELQQEVCDKSYDDIIQQKIQDEKHEKEQLALRYARLQSKYVDNMHFVYQEVEDVLYLQKQMHRKNHRNLVQFEEDIQPFHQLLPELFSQQELEEERRIALGEEVQKEQSIHINKQFSNSASQVVSLHESSENSSNSTTDMSKSHQLIQNRLQGLRAKIKKFRQSSNTSEEKHDQENIQQDHSLLARSVINNTYNKDIQKSVDIQNQLSKTFDFKEQNRSYTPEIQQLTPQFSKEIDSQDSQDIPLDEINISEISDIESIELCQQIYQKQKYKVPLLDLSGVEGQYISPIVSSNNNEHRSMIALKYLTPHPPQNESSPTPYCKILGNDSQDESNFIKLLQMEDESGYSKQINQLRMKRYKEK